MRIKDPRIRALATAARRVAAGELKPGEACMIYGLEIETLRDLMGEKKRCSREQPTRHTGQRARGK